jgi:hypothetical protein
MGISSVPRVENANSVLGCFLQIVSKVARYQWTWSQAMAYTTRQSWPWTTFDIFRTVFPSSHIIASFYILFHYFPNQTNNADIQHIQITQWAVTFAIAQVVARINIILFCIVLLPNSSSYFQVQVFKFSNSIFNFSIYQIYSFIHIV